MALDPDKIFCPSCGRSSSIVPGITPFGFRSYRCPACGHKLLYPIINRGYYAIVLATLGLVLLFSLAGASESAWGAQVLAGAIFIGLYVLERVNYILFPLGLWAFLRLIGLAHPPSLETAKKILKFTGIVALGGILVGLLGGVASLVWSGVFLVPFLAASLLSCVFLFFLWKDRNLRRHVEERQQT